MQEKISTNKDVQKLNFQFDIGKLKPSLEWVLNNADINRVNQLCLTYAPWAKKHPDDYYYQGAGSLSYQYYATKNGVKRKPADPQLAEDDFFEFIDKAKHTYFYDVFKELNKHYTIGRMRIVKVHALHCLTLHKDPTKRIHIPIISNAGNKLVVDDKAYFLPADGSAYMVDTTKPHTAFNAGLEHRYNLLCVVL